MPVKFVEAVTEFPKLNDPKTAGSLMDCTIIFPRPIIDKGGCLRSPKGWTAPREVDGHYLEGFWRAHQVPLEVGSNESHLKVLENWMRSYEPEKLFDETGRVIPELKALAPRGTRRMSANPVANGGLLRKPLNMPDFRDAAVKVDKPGATQAGNVPTLGNFLREVMRLNLHNFRVFGPDETQSNQLQALYEVGKKVWLGEYFPEDMDGGELSPNGRWLATGRSCMRGM